MFLLRKKSERTLAQVSRASAVTSLGELCLQRLKNVLISGHTMSASVISLTPIAQMPRSPAVPSLRGDLARPELSPPGVPESKEAAMTTAKTSFLGVWKGTTQEPGFSPLPWGQIAGFGGPALQACTLPKSQSQPRGPCPPVLPCRLIP